MATSAQAKAGPARAGSIAARPVVPVHAPVAAATSPAPPQPQAAPVPLGAVQVQALAVGARTRTEQLLTPGDVSLVDGETFTRRAVSNLADALRYAPGVMVHSNTGGDDGVLSIRGSNLSALNYDNSGVLLLQDGLPVSSADGANHNRLLNPLAARNIVVANGANALAYGGSDLGGAIDVISRTALNSDPNQAYLYGGSHGQLGGRVSTGGVAGDFDGLLTVAGKHLAGWRAHSLENRASVYGNIGWQVNDALDLRLYGTYIDSRQQLAGALTRAEFDTHPFMADPAYRLGNHQLNVRTARMALIGKWQLDTSSWVDFGASYSLQSLYHPIVDVFDFSTTPPRQFFSLLISTVQRTAGGMARYHLRADGHDVLVGVNLAYTTDRGGHYRNAAGARGTRTDDVYQRAGKAIAFALDRWHFAPGWTLVYGTQAIVTNRNVRDVDLDRHGVRDQRATYHSVNPRVGLLYRLSPRVQLYANVSRVYEAPNNFQLDNDARQDDSTPKATQGSSIEVGTRSRQPIRVGDDGTLHWSASLYYSRVRDEVLSVENPAEPGQMLSTNYPHTVHAGVGLRLGGDFALGSRANRIEPLVSVSANRFRFGDDPRFGDNRLPSAPAFTIDGQVLYRNRPTGFFAGPTFTWAGSRYADMTNTYRVGGYHGFGFRIGFERRHWSIFAEARNLADRRYVNAVTVLTRADAEARVLNPGAPRSLFVGVQVWY